MSETIVLPAILGVIVVINVWMTRRVQRAEFYGHQKALLLILVWLLPLMGALVAIQHLPFAAKVSRSLDEEPLPEGFLQEAPPEVIAPQGMPSVAVESLLNTASSLPQMDGAAFAAWVEQARDQASRRDAGRLATRAWLLHLRAALGEHFTLHETEQAMVLSSLEPRLVASTAEFIASARHRVMRVLEGIAHLEAEGISVLVIFDDEDDYYEYVAAFYPDDGEFAFSSGMFLEGECPHFVVRRDELAMIEPVIAHELTHSALTHLPIPRWLNEGLAVNTEQRLMGVPRPRHTAREMRAMHDEFWSEQTIQEFWSGESFLRADQGCALSYELARIVVEQMGRNWPSFVRFVGSAEYRDAGASAASTHLGIELGAYVCALLERPPTLHWRPDPGAWSSA